MSVSKDEQLESQTAGTADWDSGLNANFTILERGNHVTVPAGMVVNTGYVCWINSRGFALHYDINSATIQPHGYAWTGAASGADVHLMVRGVVRSLDINSPVAAGISAYVAAATPGLVVNSYAGAWPPVGWGVAASQLYFDPAITATSLTVFQPTLMKGAKVRHSVNSTGMDFTATGTLYWDTEDYDIEGFHAAGATNYRLTVPPAYGGMYFDIGFYFEANGSTADEYQQVGLHHYNAAGTELRNWAHHNEDGINNIRLPINVKGVLANSGDYFQCGYLNQTNSSIDVSTAAEFYIRLVGQ